MVFYFDDLEDLGRNMKKKKIKSEQQKRLDTTWDSVEKSRHEVDVAVMSVRLLCNADPDNNDLALALGMLLGAENLTDRALGLLKTADHILKQK